MLGHPDVLTEFLEQVANSQADEEIELIIAGDFVDFLAESPHEAWTADEGQAVEKLSAICLRLPALFDALAVCARRLARFTVLLGNHDVELALPRVREALFRRLGTDPHRCHFVYNNEGYRVGEVLIEHGNRYDAWNAVDHDGLREAVSAASRGERPPRELVVCPGSRLVQGAMNPLKARYHFIDLLKPEGKVLALLMLEMEPTLVRRRLPELFGAASAWVLERYRRAEWNVFGDGISPTSERLVSTANTDLLPDDIYGAFHEELSEIDENCQRNVSIGDTLNAIRCVVLGKDEDGLAAMFARGSPVADERLMKLQVALRGILHGDRTFDAGFADGECYSAAKKMIAGRVADTVIMGHTHMARFIDLPDGGHYLNTGTWADLIRIDPALLADTHAARQEFSGWLQRLANDKLEDIRSCQPTYADVVLNDEGRVVARRLRRHSKNEPFL